MPRSRSRDRERRRRRSSTSSNESHERRRSSRRRKRSRSRDSSRSRRYSSRRRSSSRDRKSSPRISKESSSHITRSSSSNKDVAIPRGVISTNPRSNYGGGGRGRDATLPHWITSSSSSGVDVNVVSSHNPESHSVQSQTKSERPSYQTSRSNRDGDYHTSSRSREYSRRDEAPSVPELNKIYRGRVATVKDFGAFIKIDGFFSHGLVHVSHLSNKQRVENAGDYIGEGTEVWVKVIKLENVESGRPKIGLSMKLVNQATGVDLDSDNSHAHNPSSGNHGGGDRRDSNDAPVLFSIHSGKVAMVKDFGAFVKLDGYYSNGLLHISHLSMNRVEDVNDYLALGQDVWVKVIKIEEVDGRMKIALSMKVVDQVTGVDIDPDNSLVNQSSSRDASAVSHKEDEFKNKTKCTKCGAFGHFKMDCFALPGETAYSIVEEPSPPPVNETQAGGGRGVIEDISSGTSRGGVGRGKSAVQPAWMTAGRDDDEGKKKKSSKKKKHKKSSKHHKKKHKKKSSKKKHKKHKRIRRNSDSSSGSDTSSDSESDGGSGIQSKAEALALLKKFGVE